MMSTQAVPVVRLAPAEPFVDPDTAANYLRTTRRHVLEMVREAVQISPRFTPRPNQRQRR